MGSWYGTCGVTQLPICDGDEVALFLLIDNSLVSSWDTNGHCHGNHYWTPRTIQLYGTYDDYGRYKIKDGWSLQFAIECLQKDAAELALGENEYHYIEVTKAKLKNWDFIQRVINEGRLLVNAHGGNRHIGQMVVHRHIFDEITKSNFDYWGGKFNVASIKKSSSVYIQLMKEYFEKDLFKDAKAKLTLRQIGVLDDRFFLFHSGHTIFGDCFESVGENNLKSIAGVHSMYRNLLADNLDSPELDDIITEMSKYVMFDTMFTTMRKTWMPQAGAGSQSEEHEVYETVMEAAAKVIKKRKACYDE